MGFRIFFLVKSFKSSSTSDNFLSNVLISVKKQRLFLSLNMCLLPTRWRCLDWSFSLIRSCSLFARSTRKMSTSHTWGWVRWQDDYSITCTFWRNRIHFLCLQCLCCRFRDRDRSSWLSKNKNETKAWIFQREITRAVDVPSSNVIRHVHQHQKLCSIGGLQLNGNCIVSCVSFRRFRKGHLWFLMFIILETAIEIAISGAEKKFD
jgi:hypothetical protein